MRSLLLKVVDATPLPGYLKNITLQKKFFNILSFHRVHFEHQQKLVSLEGSEKP